MHLEPMCHDGCPQLASTPMKAVNPHDTKNLFVRFQEVYPNLKVCGLPRSVVLSFLHLLSKLY